MEKKIVCGCYNVTENQIIEAIKNGADTVEKVGQVTKAGTGCGRCKGKIQEIIDENKEEKIVCGCYKVTENQIIEAIKNGADTVEKVGQVTKAGTGCGRCKGKIQEIIDENKEQKIVCGCYKVTENQIIEAIKNGADTVEKVGQVTKAGTGCGRCKGKIQEIIDEHTYRNVKKRGFFSKLFGV